MCLPLIADDRLSEIDLELASGQSIRLETDGSGEVEAGYAVIKATRNVGAIAVYHCFAGDVPLFQAGVPAVARHRRFSLFGSVTSNQDTALALVNVGLQPAEGIVSLFDEDGIQLGSRAFDSLPSFEAGHQVALYLSELFPGTTVENGTIRIESDPPLAAVMLRQHDDPTLAFPLDLYLLTVLPIVAVP